MLALRPAPAPAPVREPVSDVLQELNRIDEAINADRLPCNADNLWKAMLAPANKDMKGDALILVVALASLEKIPGQGVRVTNKQLAARSATIKEFLQLADQAGYPAIMTALGIAEGTTR